MYRVFEILFGGKHLNYADSKAHGYSLVTFIVFMILVTLSVILNVVLVRIKQNELRSYRRREGVPLRSEMDGIQNNKTRVVIPDYENAFLKIATSTGIYGLEIATCLSLTIVWDMLVAWDVILASTETGVIKTLLILFLIIFVSFRHSMIFGSNFYKTMMSLVKWSPLIVPVVVGYVFALMSVTKGLCG